MRFSYRPTHVLAWLQFFTLFLVISAGAFASEPRTIIVGSAGNRPIAFLDSGVRWAGLSVTVLDAIAVQEGWRISRVTAPWSELLRKLENGEIDILEGITYTTKRAKRFELSNESLLNNWAVIYAPVGTSISSLPDLDGKTVAVSTRSAHTKALNDLAKEFGVKFTAVAVPGFARVFDLLSKGEADAGLVSRTFGVGQGGKFGLLPTPIVLDPKEILYATPKGTRRDLLAAIDRYLVAAKTDPASAYNRALKQWVGGKTKTEIPHWLIATILVIGISLIVVLISAAILRRQVKNRTSDLTKSEARYRDLIEGSDLGIQIADRSAKRVFANRACAELLGYDSPEEFISVRRGGFVADHDKARVGELREEMLDGGTASVIFEFDGLLKDGSTIPIQAFMRRIVWEGEEAVQRTFVDLTERKEAEKALFESEEKLRTAFENTGIGMTIRNTKDRTILCNDAFCKMVGYSQEELAALHFNDITHPEDQEENERLRQKLMSGETDSFQITKRYIRKNGEPILVLNDLSTIRDDQGEVRFTINLFQDLTETRRAEEQLRQAQKMEVVGQLTGGVAHDFNNLLTVVHGNLELMMDRLEDPAVSRMAQNALNASVRGTELTQRLLAFSRKQALEPGVIDLNELVGHMADLLRCTLGETIEIEMAGGDDLWKCKADNSQLENAILNLTINARDAMPQGGKLTIETSNVKLDDSDVAERNDVSSGDYVMVSVSDTGTGMSRDVIDHAFEPFFTSKDVGAGSGLGLSMVHGFINQSGGFVAIDSAEGVGTSVKLYLPRTVGTCAPVRQSPKGKEFLSQGEKVLVVEDDPDVRALTVNMLVDLGYNTVEAVDGKQAIEVLQLTPGIDLLFTDVGLPGGMSGIDVAREAIQHFPNIKILFTSGYAEDVLARHGEINTNAELVHKPFRKEELAQKLRAAMDQPLN